MRAATVIVGAVAASSVLIALALILPGAGSDSATTRTRTVTELVEAPASKAKEAASAPTGGPTECDGGELSVENVSCSIGKKIHERYEEGGRGRLIAIDEEAGETITMTCEVSSPVICTGPGGARVYFAP